VRPEQGNRHDAERVPRNADPPRGVRRSV